MIGHIPQALEVAAGCYGSDGYGAGIPDHAKYASLNAVVLKSTSLHPMEGNPDPTFFDLGLGNYWNNVALRNPGIDNVVLPPLDNLRLSLYATNDREWCELVEAANALPVRSLELNLSCPAYEYPNVRDFERVLSASRKPVYLKISPLTCAFRIPTYTAGMVCGNTIPYHGGGLSGEICRPYNLQLTRELSQSIHVIGCGGVSRPEHAAQYFLAGAVRVQVGSAFRSIIS